MAKQLVIIQGASGLGKTTLCHMLNAHIKENDIKGVKVYMEDIAKFHDTIPDLELREIKIVRHKMDNISDAINDLSKGSHNLLFVDQSAIGFVSWLRFGFIQGIYTWEFYKEFDLYIYKNIALFERKIKEYDIELSFIDLVIEDEDIIKERLYGRIKEEDLAHHDELGLRLWEWNRYYPSDVGYQEKYKYDARDLTKVFELVCEKYLL